MVGEMWPIRNGKISIDFSWAQGALVVNMVAHFSECPSPHCEVQIYSPSAWIWAVAISDQKSMAKTDAVTIWWFWVLLLRGLVASSLLPWRPLGCHIRNPLSQCVSTCRVPDKTFRGRVAQISSSNQLSHRSGIWMKQSWILQTKPVASAAYPRLSHMEWMAQIPDSQNGEMKMVVVWCL